MRHADAVGKAGMGGARKDKNRRSRAAGCTAATWNCWVWSTRQDRLVDRSQPDNFTADQGHRHKRQEVRVGNAAQRRPQRGAMTAATCRDQ